MGSLNTMCRLRWEQDVEDTPYDGLARAHVIQDRQPVRKAEP